MRGVGNLRASRRTLLVLAAGVAVLIFQPLRYESLYVEQVRELGDYRGGATSRVVGQRVWVWDRWLQRACFNERENAGASGFECLDRERVHERFATWVEDVASGTSDWIAARRNPPTTEADTNAGEWLPRLRRLAAAKAYIDSLESAGSPLPVSAKSYIEKHGPPPTRLERLRLAVARHKAETACASQPDVVGRLLCQADSLDAFLVTRGWASR